MCVNIIKENCPRFLPKLVERGYCGVNDRLNEQVELWKRPRNNAMSKGKIRVQEVVAGGNSEWGLLNLSWYPSLSYFHLVKPEKPPLYVSTTNKMFLVRYIKKIEGT